MERERERERERSDIREKDFFYGTASRVYTESVKKKLHS